jgi:hypothetical protein
MAAGLGFKTFTTGEVLTAADTNGYLMQGVLVFADAAARTAAITSPQEGQMSYLKDTNSTEYYSGSAWEAVAGASGGLTLISETVASASTGITFGSIPSTYKQLILVWSGTQHDITGSQFGLRINNSSGSNYIDSYMYGTGGGAAVTNSAGASTSIGSNSGQRTFGTNNNSSSSESYHCNGFFLLDNYASSTKLKTYKTQFAYRNVADSQYVIYNGTGYYNLTTAVTSLDIVRLTGSATLSNITNSTIRLYGLS